MPINIPLALPAGKTLEKENIFVMEENRASSQDIRPLKIAILNLMPNKSQTETQLLRLLSNTPLQVNISLLYPSTHISKHTSKEHLYSFYKTFDEIKDEKFDGFIVTGAPVEKMNFCDVDYWDELNEIIRWTKKNVYTVLYVCWGAFAGLNINYGIEKHPFKEKLSGVFEHRTLVPKHPLLRGFNEVFNAPHSRYSYIRKSDIKRIPNLYLLSDSPEAGVYIAASADGREVYITGHPEYDADTLKSEYFRDLKANLSPSVPKHYFPDDDITAEPKNTWKAHANLLYSNWLNYFVYQGTPYDLNLL